MRLLLAEDERSLSRALTAILEGNRYSVDAVFDGAEALAYLETGHYDAAILDIMMPKLDGLTVLRRLWAAGSRVPVLLLTAKAVAEAHGGTIVAASEDGNSLTVTVTLPL